MIKLNHGFFSKQKILEVLHFSYSTNAEMDNVYIWVPYFVFHLWYKTSGFTKRESTYETTFGGLWKWYGWCRNQYQPLIFDERFGKKCFAGPLIITNFLPFVLPQSISLQRFPILITSLEIPSNLLSGKPVLLLLHKSKYKFLY